MFVTLKRLTIILLYSKGGLPVRTDHQYNSLGVHFPLVTVSRYYKDGKQRDFFYKSICYSWAYADCGVMRDSLTHTLRKYTEACTDIIWKLCTHVKCILWWVIIKPGLQLTLAPLHEGRTSQRFQSGLMLSMNKIGMIKWCTLSLENARFCGMEPT